MEASYKDGLMSLDDGGITIFWYYFPWGTRQIPYSQIRSFSEEPLGWMTGSLRFWGMGLPPFWFHLDPKRPAKKRCIVLDVGQWIKPVLTPDDIDAVLTILKAQVPGQAQP